MLTLPCRAVLYVTMEDNNPYRTPQSHCIVELNHLLNRGKLTSITDNINSFSAHGGGAVTGLNVNLPTIIKQTSPSRPFHARAHSTCGAEAWEVPEATEMTLCCNLQ